MKLAEIRSKFIKYFEHHQHTLVKSSPLVPANDPTLLFTNAGMVQFKDVFLGNEQRNYSRAVSVQRCLRAGGKHNDLENVGYTARHHTFFEMLGNFSFGDYFKQEAIKFAWDFLTKELKLPEERLWVTVYIDDDETADIWLKNIKVSPNRFSRCGKKDNFWSMGDTGPCGPCTEIFYDHGPDVPGGPPGSEGEELDRYIEIWNIVFMQYNCDSQGNLSLLNNQSVDTGMGIERLAAVVQNVHSNYEIDLFQSIIKAATKILNININSHDKDSDTLKSLQVLADHIRSCSFMITDGIIPSNEGRGYVLRRIIRRAVRHLNKINKDSNIKTEQFFYKLVAPLCIEMGEAYPELVAAKDTIELILKQEEEQFIRTLDQGLKILEDNLKNINNKTISGDLAFKLYDTYGFPIDLTMDIAREYDLIVDLESFEQNLLKQKDRSKKASSFKVEDNAQKPSGLQNLEQQKIETQFTGYDNRSDLSEKNIVITALLDEQYNNVDSLKFIQHQNNTDTITGYIVSDSTPFYAEGGGQVGDQGELFNNNFKAIVINTIKYKKAFLHQIKITQGSLSVGDKFNAEVDKTKRLATARNHSATHLLHAALRNLLGEQLVQKGSYVGPDYLRFDFSYFKALSAEQINQIEQAVNTEILKNTATNIDLMSIDDALNSGALALFGEKYSEKVRVLNFGEGYSVELCGGTHVDRTGDIGLFVITSESSAASGIRRIEAITGERARIYLQGHSKELLSVANLLNINIDKDSHSVEQKIKSLLEANTKLAKELDNIKQQESEQGLRQVVKKLAQKAVDTNFEDLKILVINLSNEDAIKKLNLTTKDLRTLLDQLKSELNKAVIVLGLRSDQDNSKISLIAGTTNNCVNKIHAGKLLQAIAAKLNGKAGGRPDMAQGGVVYSDTDLGLSNILEKETYLYLKDTADITCVQQLSQILNKTINHQLNKGL